MSINISDLKELVEILPFIKKEKCALFLGAGISKIAGCYDWNMIIRQLVEHESMKDNRVLKELQNSNLSNEEIINLCKKEFIKAGKEREYWVIIERGITEKPLKYSKDYLPFIKKLKLITPFPKIILTTNIDNCIEKSGIIDFDSSYYHRKEMTLQNIKNIKKPSIFHIHGYITDLKNALLTKNDYATQYTDQNFKDFLIYVFCNYSVLFLGYRFGDSDLKTLLAKAKNEMRNNVNKIKHFALIPKEDRLSEAERKNLEYSYNVKAIIYGKISDFIPAFTSFIVKYFSN